MVRRTHRLPELPVRRAAAPPVVFFLKPLEKLETLVNVNVNGPGPRETAIELDALMSLVSAC